MSNFLISWAEVCEVTQSQMSYNKSVGQHDTSVMSGGSLSTALILKQTTSLP